MFFEVELIINNAPLTYVYQDTIETSLALNYLLFGRQLLYSTSTVVTNLTVLSGTTDQINRISNRFWDKWRHEYVVNLRETQRTSKLNINSSKINVNDIVLVHFWRTDIVTVVLPRRDYEIRGAIVRILKANPQTSRE